MAQLESKSNNEIGASRLIDDALRVDPMQPLTLIGSAKRLIDIRQPKRAMRLLTQAEELIASKHWQAQDDMPQAFYAREIQELRSQVRPI
jgi:predicted Zn-dependent protease